MTKVVTYKGLGYEGNLSVTESTYGLSINSFFLTHKRFQSVLNLKVDDWLADRYCAKLSKTGWNLVNVHKGEKGWMKRHVHIATIWVWNEEEDHA